MNLSFALIILICLLSTVKTFSTEQILLGNITGAYHSDSKPTGKSIVRTTESKIFQAVKLNVRCRVDQVKCYSSDACISVTRVCDKIRDCIDNSDEIDCYRRPSSTTLKPRPIALNCTSNFTRCYDNSQCIPLLWICDGGVPDCPDKSDEIDCYRRSPTTSARTSTTSPILNCFSGYTRCYDNSDCIPVSWICNGEQDCPDKSDEIDCYRRSTTSTLIQTTTSLINCSFGQVRCYDNSRCVPVHWICDGYPDCADKSDEIDCYRGLVTTTTTPRSTTTALTCGPGFTRCYDISKCISVNWICDRDQDCNDNSDEIDCFRRPSTSATSTRTTTRQSLSCSPDYTKCNDNSKCVQLSWICDNYRDCGDNSDEIDCYRRLNTTSTSTTTTTRILTCSPGFTRCYDNSKCISVNWICDRDQDCNDNSDEIDCYRRPSTTATSIRTTTRQSSGCNAGQMKCTTSAYCIPAYWVCDGIRDCTDGSDEANCPTTPVNNLRANDRQPVTTPESRPNTADHFQNGKDRDFTDKFTSINRQQLTTPESQALTQEEATESP